MVIEGNGKIYVSKEDFLHGCKDGFVFSPEKCTPEQRQQQEQRLMELLSTDDVIGQIDAGSTVFAVGFDE